MGRSLIALSLLCLAANPKPLNVTGTWTGKLVSPHAVGFRYVLKDDDGTLTGRTFVEDPVSRKFEPEAEIHGTRKGSDASWTSESDVRVVGSFSGNTFTGTLTFPADGDHPPHSAALNLSR